MRLSKGITHVQLVIKLKSLVVKWMCPTFQELKQGVPIQMFFDLFRIAEAMEISAKYLIDAEYTQN